MLKKFLFAATAMLAATAATIVIAPASVASATPGACNGRAYVVGRSSNALMVVDTATDTIIETVTAGLNGPIGFVITADGSTGFLGNRLADTVLKYDLSTNLVARTYTGFTTPGYVAVTPSGSKVAVTEMTGSAVAILDADSGSISRVTLPANPFEIVMNHAGTKLYVTGYDTIWVIDLATETIDATIATTGSGLGIGILPDDSKVYVAQGGSGSRVDVVDTATNTIVASPSMSQPYWITVSPDGSSVWAVDYGSASGNIRKIDTVTDTVVATIANPAAPNPYLSGITADGMRLFVFGYTPGTAVIDTATDTSATATWTAPGDPWDFQTCPASAPPAPTTTSTTTAPDPVRPAFTG